MCHYWQSLVIMNGIWRNNCTKKSLESNHFLLQYFIYEMIIDLETRSMLNVFDNI